MSIDILVYEVTTDDPGIVAERAHMFVTILETGLSVTELYVFANSTVRTFVGTDTIDGRRWTSRFILPEGSHDMVFDDGAVGGRFLRAPGGFVDTEPHWPGTTSVLFSYDLDCRQGDCDLGRELTHAITNLNVLIPDTSVVVVSGQLALEGKHQAQDNVYMNYVGHDLTAGQELDLRVRLPGAAPLVSRSERGGTSALPWIVLGTAVGVLALVYPFWRRRVESAARKPE
jgi:hypothetical protein